jgi:hyaluronoglucosaminidase
MTSRRRRRSTARASAALVAAALFTPVIACSGGEDDDAADDTRDPSEEATTTTADPTPEPELSDRTEPLPVVTPTPRDMRWLGPDVEVTRTVSVVADDGADPAALAVVREVLETAGAREVREADGAAEGLTVRVGSATDADLRDVLGGVGVDLPGDLPAEGYGLAAYSRSDGSAELVLAGGDDAGTFYAAQTLRQLTTVRTIAGVGIIDHPAMRHRGTIEGFYGSPWTTGERLDQLAFHGRFKLNTYVYAPKDDPYHRDRWREPYPADRLAALRRLVDAAADNHVRFTFAVSPGVSICYSAPADRAALEAKLAALYELGVRTFSIALDDIDHTVWHCDGDADRYGVPSTAAAARAQADLLNAVQRGFVTDHDGVEPLQMVPTEYRGTRDSPYRTELRSRLDPAVEVMWTGRFVVPDEITVAQATDAAATFGRRLYVWDNTPVNDFPRTAGRLILAPYARRERGLSATVTGVVLNPMNQAAASKVQLVGGADFAWNDAAYDPARAHRAAAVHLAAGHEPTVEALLAFFDLGNLAPTSANSGVLSQPQAPALAAALDTFRRAWAAGDRQGSIDGLRPVAERIAGAPDLIREHVPDVAFLADCAPWLDATRLWGAALVGSLDALQAAVAGDVDGAGAAWSTVRDAVTRASAIETIPGETRPQGPVRVGDGVLDLFIAEADGLA